MAIEKKSLSEVSSTLRAAYQKAQEAARKKNLEYAIGLLKNVVNSTPGFMDAREKLREFENALPPPGPFKSMGNKLKAAKFLMLGQMSMGRKKYRDAMARAEDALEADFGNISALKLLAQAADAEEAYFISVEALEIAEKKAPKDLAILDTLARTYRANHQAKDALRVRQKISSMRPDDLAAQSAVREAAAAATMEQNWDKGKSFTEHVRAEKEGQAVEQGDRVIRNIDDINEQIGKMEGRLEQEGSSIDFVRRLGELYQRAGRHEEAITMFNKAVELIGTMDPTIDRLIEKSEVAKIDASGEQWRQYAESNPDSRAEAEQNIAAFEEQKHAYRLSKALERVSNYANDTQLRYELALIHWEGKDIDNAIEQFQLAQRNPQRRLSALVYLGRCFHEKGQYDIAVEQFQRAIADMLTMNKEKMEAMYCLGITFETMGRQPEALECFKAIYQEDAKFSDVADRVRGSYAKK